MAPESDIQLRLSLSPQWWNLSEMLRDLIIRMLRVNPNDRLTSEQALKHPWFVMCRNQTLREERKFVEIRDLKSMAIYGKTSILKKITLMYLAVRLDQNSCPEIKQKFEQADRDDNGIINEEEFNLIFQQASGNENIPLRSTSMLFDMLDTNNNGTIEFSEFKAALIRTTLYLQENQLAKAF